MPGPYGGPYPGPYAEALNAIAPQIAPARLADPVPVGCPQAAYVDEAIDAYYDTLFPQEQPERDPFAVELVKGAVKHLPELDELITKHAAHWRMERMPNCGPQHPAPGGL